MIMLPKALNLIFIVKYQWKTYIANLTELFHYIFSAYHVLLDYASEFLSPLFSTLLIIHNTHFCFLKAFGIFRCLNFSCSVNTLKKIIIGRNLFRVDILHNFCVIITSLKFPIVPQPEMNPFVPDFSSSLLTLLYAIGHVANSHPSSLTPNLNGLSTFTIAISFDDHLILSSKSNL